MNAVSSVNAKKNHRGGSFGRVSFLTVGVSVGGSILLATKVYFVSELLVILVALALLFAVATGALLLLVVLQEGVRWSARQIIEAKQRAILSRGAPSFRS